MRSASLSAQSQHSTQVWVGAAEGQDIAANKMPAGTDISSQQLPARTDIPKAGIPCTACLTLHETTHCPKVQTGLVT